MIYALWASADSLPDAATWTGVVLLFLNLVKSYIPVLKDKYEAGRHRKRVTDLEAHVTKLEQLIEKERQENRQRAMEYERLRGFLIGLEPIFKKLGLEDIPKFDEIIS